jgi:hypothetical protein
VRVRIVGDGVAAPSVRRLAGEAGEAVEALGRLDGSAKWREMEGWTVGLGHWASHRRGLRESANLKLREYCAFGLPFYSIDEDGDFGEEPVPGCWSVGRDADPDVLLDFALGVADGPVRTGERARAMRAYAESRLSWGAKVDRLAGFWRSCLR